MHRQKINIQQSTFLLLILTIGLAMLPSSFTNTEEGENLHFFPGGQGSIQVPDTAKGDDLHILRIVIEDKKGFDVYTVNLYNTFPNNAMVERYGLQNPIPLKQEVYRLDNEGIEAIRERVRNFDFSPLSGVLMAHSDQLLGSAAWVVSVVSKTDYAKVQFAEPTQLDRELKKIGEKRQFSAMREVRDLILKRKGKVWTPE